MVVYENKPDDTRGAASLELCNRRALLRSEIRFWRELIDSCGDKEPVERLERMCDALALAEWRLGELSAAHLAAVPKDACRTAGLYEIKSKI